jgi:hypothetical protein
MIATKASLFAKYLRLKEDTIKLFLLNYDDFYLMTNNVIHKAPLFLKYLFRNEISLFIIKFIEIPEPLNHYQYHQR